MKEGLADFPPRRQHIEHAIEGLCERRGTVIIMRFIPPSEAGSKVQQSAVQVQSFYLNANTHLESR